MRSELFGALPQIMLGRETEMCVLQILRRKGVYVSDGTNREILEAMDTSHESLPGDKSQLL
jgi:hypothetical protein